MTDPLPRFGEQAEPVSRRAGTIPGRRFAFVLAVALLLLGYSAGVAGADAGSDQTVVSATIYPSSQGSVTYPSVSLSTLQNCPLYSGSSPMYLYPGDQPYQPASDSSWALSTVLTCGLQLPLGDVTNVQVQSSSQGFEAPLSNTELSDPSQFQDPRAAQALPVISHDGGEDQNTYFRPWLGAADDNAKDEVVASGSPITIVVYEGAPPLSVSASWQTVSKTATAMSVQFSATVHDAGGAAVPASALTWSWSFGDGGTSTDQAPAHSFAAGGSYFVTVQVTDAGAGSGGTATIEVSSQASGAPAGSGPPAGSPHGGGPGTGGGPRKRPVKQPARSGERHRGKGGATTKRNSKRPKHTTATSTTPADRNASSVSGRHGKSGSSADRSATASTHRASAPAARATVHATSPPARPSSTARSTNSLPPFVTGRLISDITPLPPGASSLVRDVRAILATAPVMRRAVRGSSLPGIAAGFGVILLLGLGAARELGWWRHWGALRFGT